MSTECRDDGGFLVGSCRQTAVSEWTRDVLSVSPRQQLGAAPFGRAPASCAIICTTWTAAPPFSVSLAPLSASISICELLCCSGSAFPQHKTHVTSSRLLWVDAAPCKSHHLVNIYTERGQRAGLACLQRAHGSEQYAYSGPCAVSLVSRQCAVPRTMQDSAVALTLVPAQ